MSEVKEYPKLTPYTIHCVEDMEKLVVRKLRGEDLFSLPVRRDMRAAHKYCLRCDQHKEISSFGRDKRASDGLKYYCRRCCSDMQFTRWRDAHPFAPRRNRVPNSLSGVNI